MKSADKTERMVRAASFRANVELDEALWAEIAAVHDESAPDVGRRSPLRMVLGSYLMRLAAVVVLLAAVVLWQQFDIAGKAYALSNAIAAVRQARTIHIRTTMYKDRVFEYWYDLEQGREYRHHDGAHPKAHNSPDTYRERTTTVRDGQYLMKIDHQKQTVRFERLLSWEQEFHKLQMADLAVNAALPDVAQYLNRYTKIGKDTIDGQSYDVWRREWRIPFKSEVRERYDIWISPSGEIGRTRRWIREGPSDWLLHLETDKIEINQEPPAGTFTTEPPAGYTLENTKETADILRRDFLLRRTRQGSELSALPCLTLEDGSVVAIWTVVGGRTQVDPNRAYAGLTWGGPVPQPALSLLGLVFAPGAQSYGSVAHWDENAPATMVPAVGRHLICTIKGDRTYEWALYVPREVIPNQKSRNLNIVGVVKSNEDSTSMVGSFLISTPVTPEQFARYLSEAFRELSNDPSIPVSMNYEDLLRLARSVRGDKRLYEDFARHAKSIMDTPAPEAVETVPPDRVQ